MPEFVNSRWSQLVTVTVLYFGEKALRNPVVTQEEVFEASLVEVLTQLLLVEEGFGDHTSYGSSLLEPHEGIELDSEVRLLG